MRSLKTDRSSNVGWAPVNFRLPLFQVGCASGATVTSLTLQTSQIHTMCGSRETTPPRRLLTIISLGVRGHSEHKDMIPSKENSHVSTQTVLFHNTGHDYCFRCGRKVKRSDQ